MPRLTRTQVPTFSSQDRPYVHNFDSIRNTCVARVSVPVKCDGARRVLILHKAAPGVRASCEELRRF